MPQPPRASTSPNQLMHKQAGAKRMAAVLLLVTAIGLQPQAAQAGRSCEIRKPTLDAIAQGMTLAQNTANALDASGAQVVILARAGQDLSRYRLRWSHAGFAYRTDEGTWRVVHKLNACGTAHGGLYRQGLGQFFLDDPWRFEAAWAPLAPQAQQQVLQWLKQPGDRIAQVHEPAYSLVSYAWGTRYQQSNQWVSETLAAAMEPDTIRTRQQAQAWLQFKGYEPSVFRLGPLTRLGGRISSANVAFNDHPSHKRFNDRIETVTADSVFDWLLRARLAGPIQTITP